MKGVSVVICCYNSGIRLIPTLNHLAKQQRLAGVECEIILVDNNCTDDTVEEAKQYWNSVNAAFPMQVVQEPNPGLSFARRKGIDSANFEYVVLCDDDNWLCVDYLKRTVKLLEKLPDVAMLGGVGEPEFESVPPDWFNKLKGFGYAVGTEGRFSGYVDSVYGAGMAIRKSVFKKLIHSDSCLVLTDRKGNALSSGGDVEICLIFKKAGYNVFMDTNLCFKHFLTTDRLQWGYYLKLRKAFGVANAYLEAYRNQKPKTMKGNFINICRQAFLFFTLLLRRIHFFMFPNYFQNAACAQFIQTLSMRKTLLFKAKTIRLLTAKINCHN